MAEELSTQQCQISSLVFTISTEHPFVQTFRTMSFNNGQTV